MSGFVPVFVICKSVDFLIHSKQAAGGVHQELQNVYGDAAVYETMCCDWILLFKHGKFDVDDCFRGGSSNRSKTMNYGPCWVIIRAKREESWLEPLELPREPFPS